MNPWSGSFFRQLRKRGKLLLLAAFFISCSQSQGQSLQYSFTTSTTNYASIVGGNSIFSAYADDDISALVPIGFSFRLGDSNYTHCKISSNGFISFNTLAIDSYVNGLATVGATNMAPLLAPLWDDLQVSSTGSVKTLLSGTSPTRVFTVEWKNMEWDFNAQTGVVSFELKLYEGSNRIEFAYKDNGYTINTASASVGLAGKLPGEYYSLTNFSANPIASQSVETNTISDKPATGQLYQWQQASLVPLILVSFDAYTRGKTVSVDWKTSDEQAVEYFMIEKSNDGKSFKEWYRLTAKGRPGEISSYTASDPWPFDGKNYYRLRIAEQGGRSSLGQVRVVEFMAKDKIRMAGVSGGGFIPVSFSDAVGDYIISLFSVDGKLIAQQRAAVRNTQEQFKFIFNNPKRGTFIIRVQNTQTAMGVSRTILLQ